MKSDMHERDTDAKQPLPRRVVRFLRPAALLILTVVVAVGCSEGLGGFLISNAQEVDIGEGVDEQIEQEYAIVVDTEDVAVWARDLVEPLSAASVEFRDPGDIGGYKVEVIADNELINAFAAPGGYTYITTGLILNATTCAEIAGVMGHELAHVTERHSVKSIESQFAVETLSSWLLGDGLASDGAATISAFLQGTTFSRDKEAEADSVGLQIAYNAGYNPYGLVDFFEKLLALSGGASPPEFLSSHPATQDRINDVAAEIQQRYGNQVIRGETQSYNCLNTSMQLSAVQESIRNGLQTR